MLSTLRQIKRPIKWVIYRSIYRFGIATGRQDALIPPRDLHSIGDGDFTETGDEFFRIFVEFANLKQNESVLDVGCGTGRMARPLASYLTSGHYDGIDIVRPSISWCQQTYSKQFPNFKFHHLNAYNGYYNPGGQCVASEYRFPFEDSTFDFIFLTSVFTHMLPADVENYAREISRMLKPGGRCLITYFLLNPDSYQSLREGKADRTFDNEMPGCRVQYAANPEAAVAYEERDVSAIYTACDLQVMEPIRYGRWSGRQDGTSYQDLVLARKLDFGEIDRTHDRT